MHGHAPRLGVSGFALAAALSWGAQARAQAIPPVAVPSRPMGRVQIAIDPRRPNTAILEETVDGRPVAAPIQCTASCEVLLPVGTYRLSATRSFRITAQRDVIVGPEGVRLALTYEPERHGGALGAVGITAIVVGLAGFVGGLVLFGMAASSDGNQATGIGLAIGGGVVESLGVVLVAVAETRAPRGTQRITTEPLARVSFGVAPLAGGGGMGSVGIRF